MEYITTEKAAEILGVSRSRILALINEGRIHAEKVGRDWIIDPEEIDNFERKPQGNSKLTKQDIQAIIKKYNQGVHPALLADQYGVSERTIYRRVKQ